MESPDVAVTGRFRRQGLSTLPGGRFVLPAVNGTILIRRASPAGGVALFISAGP